MQFRYSQVYLIQFILPTSYIPCRAHIISYHEVMVNCSSFVIAEKIGEKKHLGFIVPPGDGDGARMCVLSDKGGRGDLI